MSEPFIPEPGELIPLEELLALAEVTEDDVSAAVEKWKDNPPDPEFENILEAEPE